MKRLPALIRPAAGRARWVSLSVVLLVVFGTSSFGDAQDAAAAPPAAARQIGTVVSVAAHSLVLKPDKTDGVAEVSITVDPDARVIQLAPGSTDLKSAAPAQLADISVGDRVLVTGTAGESAALFIARRVVLMRSAAISEQRDAQEADWQRRGTGGIVVATDPMAGTVAVTAGTRKLTLTTTPKTLFRRYREGSVRFADTQKSTLAEIHPGDQLRVRGTRSGDGSSIAAEEVVSGTFSHVSGTVLSTDGHTLTLKDLHSKQTVTIAISDSSTIRTLPKELATRMAARGKGGHPAGEARPAAPAAVSPDPATAGERGNDVGQLIARLPETPAAELRKGDAVLIVGVPAAGSAENKDAILAITILRGAEPILAANPNGESDTDLGSWDLGGAPAGGV